MENRKGKRSSVPMTNLAVFLIISLAILPEMTVARQHYPTPAASPPPSETPPPPPSPKKSDTRGGEVYYLPPNGI
ncbi:hypothetical protein V6N13_127497 [Hibiscus sabdariffa]